MQESQYNKKISHPRKRVVPIRLHAGAPVSLAVPSRRAPACFGKNSYTFCCLKVLLPGQAWTRGLPTL